MKNLSFVSFLALSFSGVVAAKPMWVSVDAKVLESIKPHLSESHAELFQGKLGTVLKLESKQVEEMSSVIHHKLNRCGGFAGFESLSEAKNSVDNKNGADFGKKYVFADYSINQQDKIHPMINDVSEIEIRQMIIKLTSFTTRYFGSKEGVASTQYIYDTWAKLGANRKDVSIEQLKHAGYNQPTVIMTITGSEHPEEIVVLGGHADSISDHYTAPGADDNASGIATTTEVIRQLMLHDIQPKRTVKFMAYAAEEVGLWGSRDVARAFKKEKKNVIGVMQLDMTLFKGTEEKDILLTTDWTNKAQNEFLGKLVDEYVKVPWGFTSCGYACSDHASWSDQGYPAAYPQEAYMDSSNPHIHTDLDTLETSGGTADHAVKFAKLGVAFVMELAN